MVWETPTTINAYPPGMLHVAKRIEAGEREIKDMRKD